MHMGGGGSTCNQYNCLWGYVLVSTIIYMGMYGYVFSNCDIVGLQICFLWWISEIFVYILGHTFAILDKFQQYWFLLGHKYIAHFCWISVIWSGTVTYMGSTWKSPATHLCPIHPAFRLGPVCRGRFGEVLSFLRPTIHTISECPRFPGTITVEWFSAVRTGCVLGHRATTIRTCAHLMKTASRYINYEPKVALSSPDPTSLVGEVPASVHTMGLPGKVPLAGESPGKRTWCERRVKGGGSTPPPPPPKKKMAGIHLTFWKNIISIEHLFFQ